MNDKFFYPALFHKEDGGGFWVSFPDIPECLTQGEDISTAYEMAVDALGLAMEERIKTDDIPAASEPDSLECEKDARVVIIELDMEDYLRRHSKKAVKKTLSIPQWLNEAALACDINFSAVLQEALMEKLGL